MTTFWIVSSESSSGHSKCGLALASIKSISIALVLLLSISLCMPGEAQSLTGGKTGSESQLDRKIALEAELASIIGANAPGDGGDRQLARAIISRLMLDNMTESSAQGSGNGAPAYSVSSGSSIDEDILGLDDGDSAPLAGSQEVAPWPRPTPIEALREGRLFEYLQDYAANNEAYGVPLGQYPILPNGQIATMKRATSVANSLLQRSLPGNGWPHNYDYAKRPDSSALPNVLRIGDSSSRQVQPTSHFGKRPSGHRYEFGLGKRVANKNYPRYDFGLGKRGSRYEFGLGK